MTNLPGEALLLGNAKPETLTFPRSQPDRTAQDEADDFWQGWMTIKQTRNMSLIPEKWRVPNHHE